MSGQTEPLASVPTAAEVREAEAVLLDGLHAVELGHWTSDMQEARDRAHGIITRARAAGVR